MQTGDHIETGEIKFRELIVEEELLYRRRLARTTCLVMRGSYIKVTPGATRMSSSSPLLTSAALDVQ
jgi:hypothetical protein